MLAQVLAAALLLPVQKAFVCVILLCMPSGSARWGIAGIAAVLRCPHAQDC